MAIELLRPFHVGQVRDACHFKLLRADNVRRQKTGRRQRFGGVEISDDDQGCNVKLGQSTGGRRLKWLFASQAVRGLKGDEIHLTNPFTHLGGDLVRCAIWAVNPDLQLQFVDLRKITRLLGQVKLLGLPRHTAGEYKSTQCRSNEDKSICHFGVFKREVDSDFCALRTPYKRCVLDLQKLQQLIQVSVVRIISSNHGCLSEATSIIPQHLVLLCKDMELFVPHPAIGNSRMNQNEWRPFSGNLIVEPGVTHLGKTVLLHTGVTSFRLGYVNIATLQVGATQCGNRIPRSSS